MSAKAMISEARKHLGLGEPNHIQAWYRKRNGSDYAGNFPWCDAFISYCAAESGNAKAVGEFAYTPSHAAWFKKKGQWHSGKAGIRPGDIVFFDWSGTRSISNIDHVGLVEKVVGGTVYTIEGNISDHCMRKARDATYIVGYGRPAYGQDKPIVDSKMRFPLQFKEGSTGKYVEVIQRRLNFLINAKLDVDGEFGPATKTAVNKWKKSKKWPADGIVGVGTWDSFWK